MTQGLLLPKRTFRLSSILSLTFLESFGTVLLERGIYFLVHDRFGFDETQNLWLALAFGVPYIGGALSSHAAARVLGEKRLLVLSLGVLFVVHSTLTAFPRPLAVQLLFPVVGFLQGLKWPIVESYVGAGHTPRELASNLGRFNTTWALSIPLAMASSGPLIQFAPSLLFAVASALNLVSIALALPMPKRPLHLETGHPARPRAEEAARMIALLTSARWCMLLSYAILFLLAPLMPQLFRELGLGVTAAPSAAGILDVARVACFALLGVWVGWRGQVLPLLLATLVMPISFFSILYGQNLVVVLAAEVVYGIAAGFTYTAALYYALLLKNASVDAGGAHEGLIGLGFALGPLVGLVANGLRAVVGSSLLAMTLSVAPLIATCAFFGLLPLRKAR